MIIPIPEHVADEMVDEAKNTKRQCEPREHDAYNQHCKKEYEHVLQYTCESHGEFIINWKKNIHPLLDFEMRRKFLHELGGNNHQQTFVHISAKQMLYPSAWSCIEKSHRTFDNFFK